MGTGHDHGPGRTLTATGRYRGRLATVLVITVGIAVAEIPAATVNALLLLGLAVFILVEAARRLASPPTVEPGVMIVFEAVALAGNGVSLLLLRHGQAESLNVRG